MVVVDRQGDDVGRLARPGDPDRCAAADVIEPRCSVRGIAVEDEPQDRGAPRPGMPTCGGVAGMLGLGDGGRRAHRRRDKIWRAPARGVRVGVRISRSALEVGEHLDYRDAEDATFAPDQTDDDRRTPPTSSVVQNPRKATGGFDRLTIRVVLGNERRNHGLPADNQPNQGHLR